MDYPNEGAENLLRRKQQLEITLLAQDHLIEIVRTAAAAEDSEALAKSIAALLDISVGYAHMIRLMPLDKLASLYGRQRVEEELAELQLILRN